MKDQDLTQMNADELWVLYQKIRAILPSKLDAERHRLERRLVQLGGHIENKPKGRRPYPKVHPKYRNPDTPSETWSGLGKATALGRRTAKVRKEGRGELLIAQTH